MEEADVHKLIIHRVLVLLELAHNLFYMRKIMFSILGLVFFSCNNRNNEILISIYIGSNSIETLFLTDGYNWEQPIRTARKVNGSFTFRLRENELPETIYSITYKNEKGKFSKLKFYNHVLSTDTQKYILDAFLIDSSFITIGQSKKLEGYYSIKAGKETEAFFKTQMMIFGYLDADLTKRSEQLQQYVSIAASYPGSVYLLQKINENKSTLKKAELTALLNQFNSKAVNNNLYKALKKYAASKNDHPFFENYKFENQLGIATEMYSSKAKVNMVVFWASWCAPCRQEIPELKKLAEKYNRSELNIVSVSIDESRKSWLSAVAAEQMNWPQLIIPESNRQHLKEKFEVGAIPYTLFLDSNGKLITRFIGNDGNIGLQYEQIINANLK